MLYTKWTASFAAALMIVGCADETVVVDSSDAVDNTLSDTETTPAESETAAASETDSVSAAEPKEPASEFVALPDGMPDQLTAAYEGITEAAGAGNPEGLLSLAGISQQIASQSAASDPKAANAFFKQSAMALRKGREAYEGELPGSFVGPIFYNEACTFAKEGNSEVAEKSLAEAIECGFSDFDLLRTDPDMETIRSASGFEDKLKQWETAALEKQRERVKKELADSTSFDFDFTLNDIEGNEQSLAAYKGKVVIVDIWGTWCPPCREEIPSFVKLQEKLGDKGFQMLGLNYEHSDEEENLATVGKFVEEHGINYPCILGDDETKQQVPNFEGFPTTLFIDRSGKVRMTAVGMHEYSYLEAIVNALLEEEEAVTDAAE